MKLLSCQLPWTFRSVKELKMLVIGAGSEGNNDLFSVFFFFSNEAFHYYYSHLFFVLGILFGIFPRSYLLAIKMMPQKMRFHFKSYYSPFI